MKRLALLLLLPFIVATSAVGEVNWPDALKGVADDLYAYQGWIIRQIFPDTAEKEYLEFTRCRTGWTGHQCE